MRVRVLLFGPLAEIYGVREERIDLRDGARVSDLYSHYHARDPRLGKLASNLRIAVNQSIASPDAPLAAEDEVALLPPVSGGSGKAEIPDHIELVDTPLEEHPLRLNFDASGEFGAVTTFEGLVRRENEADPVVALSFDAYRPMAMAQLRELAAEARARWEIRRIVMLHRLGVVPAGQICVLVAVATGHRDQAFAACKFLIDTLKAKVPIWKKEITASGSHWVEGTLIPAPETDTVR